MVIYSFRENKHSRNLFCVNSHKYAVLFIVAKIIVTFSLLTNTRTAKEFMVHPFDGALCIYTDRKKNQQYIECEKASCEIMNRA